MNLAHAVVLVVLVVEPLTWAVRCSTCGMCRCKRCTGWLSLQNELGHSGHKSSILTDIGTVYSSILVHVTYTLRPDDLTV